LTIQRLTNFIKNNAHLLDRPVQCEGREEEGDKRMPSFSADIEFEVFCSKCGAGLCNRSDAASDRKGHRVSIEPCSKCLEVEYDDGYEKGYSAGLKDAEAEKE
jgi:hypothetical protein